MPKNRTPTLVVLSPQKSPPCARVTEPTAASGRERKAEEGKTTSEQEGIYAVAVRDDCFSGQGTACGGRVVILSTKGTKNRIRTKAEYHPTVNAILRLCSV